MMASSSRSPLTQFVEHARGQSIPAPRTWAATLNVPRSVRRIRSAFAYAEALNSEHHGYEGINEGLRIPVRYYSRKGHRQVHCVPQGILEVLEKVTHRDIELAKDPSFPHPDKLLPAPPTTMQTRARARRVAEGPDSAAGAAPHLPVASDIEHGAYFWNEKEAQPDSSNETRNLNIVPPRSSSSGPHVSFASSISSITNSSTPSALTTFTSSTASVSPFAAISATSAASSSAATTSSDSSTILQDWKSHHLTDFLLAVSGYTAEGEPLARRGLVAVIEAKKMPPYDKNNPREELRVATAEAERTLPQLIQQARYGFKQYPNQDSVWGIIIVGRCCQFYKLDRELALSDKYERVFHPAPGKTIFAYAMYKGGIHRMVEPKRDRYTDAFRKHFHDMMEWSEELLR
ncbi:hypothetical protein OF83DRAFT_1158590 [Amylostereum chailletii]|nr:hypothetical protein OF83DRAFT_1158590 [Amylostereum chailletii]